MEDFPVEVIGKILSHVGRVQHVVRASGTCRKWRQATRNHLHTLECHTLADSKFKLADMEVFFTETILQTSSLNELCFCAEQVFSAAVVISWLLHARSYLRILRYKIRVGNPRGPLQLSVLERCGKMACLEILDLDNIQVMDVDFAVQRWPSLVSLLLRYSNISVIDLNTLLLACSKLESLTLEGSTIVLGRSVTVSSSTLKAFHLDFSHNVDSIILEAEVLESLDLECCKIEHFRLESKGNLRILRIKSSRIDEWDIGPATGKLEVLHVSNAEIPWPRLGDFLSKIPNLKELQLRRMKSGGYSDVMAFEAIGRLFPHLNHLATTLDYEVMKGDMDHLVSLQRTCVVEKLVLLDLESTTILNDIFCRWIEVFLEIYPSLKRLVVHGPSGATQEAEELSIGGRYNSIGVHRRVHHSLC